MTKTQALKQVAELLEQQVTALVNSPLPDSPVVVAALRRVQKLRAEVLAHAEQLGYAEMASQLGQEDAVPDGWHEAYGEEPFYHHAFVFESLAVLPNEGQLSLALLAYLKELPRQRQAAHDEVMAWLLETEEQQQTYERYLLLHSALLDNFQQLAGQPSNELSTALARWQASDTTPLSLPLSQLSPAEVRRFSMAVLTQYQELTLFTVDYATDLARARDLAGQGGSWVEIRACLV